MRYMSTRQYHIISIPFSDNNGNYTASVFQQYYNFSTFSLDHVGRWSCHWWSLDGDKLLLQLSSTPRKQNSNSFINYNRNFTRFKSLKMTSSSILIILALSSCRLTCSVLLCSRIVCLMPLVNQIILCNEWYCIDW